MNELFHYTVLEFESRGGNILKDHGVQEMKLVNVEHTKRSMPNDTYPKTTLHPQAIMLSK
jgi:hypothetical protein